jgi:ABC-type nitrate/sulfonate/bicarbonate transport system permease component
VQDPFVRQSEIHEIKTPPVMGTAQRADDRSVSRAIFALIRRIRIRLGRFYSIFILLASWQLAAIIIDNQLFLPRLSTVIETISTNLLNGQLEVDIEASTFRCLTGFALALVFGTALGLLMGWSPKWDNFWNLAISFTNPIPKLGLIPLFILWLGIGESSKIAVIFSGAVFPILINTYNGVKGVNKLWLWRATTVGANHREVLFKVVLPAALPHILTGARLGMAVAWIVLLGAEMVAAEVGLGFRILYGGQTFNTPLVFAGLLVIATLGFLFDRLILATSTRLCRWYFRPDDEFETTH